MNGPAHTSQLNYTATPRLTPPCEPMTGQKIWEFVRARDGKSFRCELVANDQLGRWELYVYDDRTLLFVDRGFHTQESALKGSDRCRVVLGDRRRRRNPTMTSSAPPVAPPELHCPACGQALIYRRSSVTRIGSGMYQWDHFTCPGRCGDYEYRPQTRKLRLTTR